MAAAPAYDLVIPTVGRPSLATLLQALATGERAPRGRILVVDDRVERTAPLPVPELPPALAERLAVLPGRAAGPAAARNIGWRAATEPWVAFLDDDVVPPWGWVVALERDLASCSTTTAATQGRIVVPLPRDRRPTDWERNVAGLEGAQWATADMAFRRTVLEQLGGFDERFPRAYREDADLGLRIGAAGYRIVLGSRSVVHPVRPAPWHVSVGKQAGNADDALMDRLHGTGWRVRAGAPRGARAAHHVTTAIGLLALIGVATRRSGLSGAAGAAWVARTAALAARRIAPGPRAIGEVAAMVATSAVLPPAASSAYLRGVVRARKITTGGAALVHRARPPVEAVLFDRDGTLLKDVAYNGDPDLVEPVPQARAALDRLRAAGLPIAIVSNQSGVARGLLDLDQVAAVNERVEDLLGPFAAILVCPHGPDDGCRDRKPGPGLVERAAHTLGVPVEHCAVIGDIGSDVQAALTAGAQPILVPTPVTRHEEIAAAPVVVDDLQAAVDLVLAEAVT